MKFHNRRGMVRWRLIVVLVIFVLFILFDFFPKVRDILILRQKITLAQLSINPLTPQEKEERRKKLTVEKRFLEEALRFIRKAEAEIRAKVVSQKNLPMITIFIEDIAASAQIDLDSIRPLVAYQQEGYEFLPVEIGFQGQYDKLVDFLFKIEESSSLITVQDLKISKSGLEDSPLNILLTFNVLFAPEKKTAP